MSAEIKMQMVRKAVSLLASIGVPHKVKFEHEGVLHEWGDLIAVEPKLRTRVHSGLKYDVHYKPVMDSMAPGETRFLDVADHLDVEAMRGSANSYGFRLWGKGAVTTTVFERRIAITRNFTLTTQ